MNNKVLLTCLLCLLATISAPVIGHAQLANGDFELPAIPDRTLEATTPTGWSGGGLLMNPDAFGMMAGDNGNWPQPQSGAQYEDIGNLPAFALSQNFSISSDGSYEISWYDNTALGLNDFSSPYSASLVGSDSTPVFTANYDAQNNGLWERQSQTTSLLAGSYTLTFTSLNLPNSLDALIDSVAVRPIPEPSAIAIAMGAAICLCGLRKRGWR